MARTLNPFTRITLLLGELNGNKLENLLDTKKCDLVHHTAKLSEEITDLAQKDSALLISEQGKSLFALIKEGDLVKAEAERQTLISSCKKLKDLL